MLRNNIVKRMTKMECYSNRLIFVKISAKTVDIVIVQVYRPTMDHDDVIEKIYYQINNILHQKRRGQVNVIVRGDFTTY